jgi:hypothetical protein
MKLIIALLFLLPSMMVEAKPKDVYLVMQWNNTTRIVLQDKSCLIEGLTGSRAVVQRTDGAFIQGCWKYEQGGKFIRIDWNNPHKLYDFAVLKTEWFDAVEE